MGTPSDCLVPLNDDKDKNLPSGLGGQYCFSGEGEEGEGEGEGARKFNSRFQNTAAPLYAARQWPHSCSKTPIAC